MDKNILRKKILTERIAFADNNTHNNTIYNKIISNNLFKKSDLLLCYVSTSIEVDTSAIINYCFKNNKKVALPKVNGDLLDFIIVESLNGLKSGYRGILEPENGEYVTDFSNSVCIVPALCYDRAGYRIGYGKGFYDRFLSQYNGVSIGICYENFIREFEHSEFDISVDVLITG